MADLAFAQHSNEILKMLPHWFKIRKDSKDSIGARFLNIAGLELDDALYVIEYAYQQCYSSTIDISQVDFCYKAIIPMPFKASKLDTVFANSVGLRKANTIKDFFGIDQRIGTPALYSFESYFLDDTRNIIYVRQKFNVDAIHENGKITLNFTDGTSCTLALMPHPVWNYFDELGALLSCPRIYGEPNIEYKKRIEDVFKNKANASKDGLINGIARELAIRRTITWVNPKTDLELTDPMIVLNSITIEGQKINKSKVFLTSAGTILIRALGISTPVEVSYVYNLEMHELYNKNDTKLYNELFTIEGKAKNKLRQYIEILNSESPIFWNDFHWNEHYWDQNEKDVSGLGYIPHLYDGSIRGFKKYRG